MKRIDKLAENYLDQHGRTGGSSLKTIDTYIAGYKQAIEDVIQNAPDWLYREDADHLVSVIGSLLTEEAGEG